MRRSVLWLVPALMAAGCDRQSPKGGQAEVAGANTAPANAALAISPDEVAPAGSDTSGGGASATPVGTIDRSHAGEAAPAFAFADPHGKSVTMASFRGKPVLLNLWATWCGPCIKELPTLNALAQRDAGKLMVVTLSQDNDAGKAAPFLAGRGLKALGAYTDPAMHWVPAMASTLPTSIYYGADGKERWRVAGPREWTDAATAKALAS